MKRALILVLAAILLLSGIANAYTLQMESKFNKSDALNLVGNNKFIALDMFSMAKNRGTLFFLVRDKATRNLEWFHIDPMKKSVIASGSCPFKAFVTMDISPTGADALVMTRYPTALYHLNLSSRKWTEIYRNPGNGKKGLALLSISPISFAETVRAFSIMDMWDEEHFVTETYVTSFIPSTAKLEEVAAMDALSKKTVAKLALPNPAGMLFKIDSLRFADNKSFAYVLQSRVRNKKGSARDYLLTYSPTGEITSIDNAEGRVQPLDYHSNPSRILYTVDVSGKNQIFFQADGKKEVVLEGKGLAGRIMKNNLLGVTTVDGKTFNVFLGKPGAKLKKAVTLHKPYSAGFLEDGSKLILANMDEVIVYRILEK